MSKIKLSLFNLGGVAKGYSFLAVFRLEWLPSFRVVEFLVGFRMYVEKIITATATAIKIKPV